MGGSLRPTGTSWDDLETHVSAVSLKRILKSTDLGLRARLTWLEATVCGGTVRTQSKTQQDRRDLVAFQPNPIIPVQMTGLLKRVVVGKQIREDAFQPSPEVRLGGGCSFVARYTRRGE